MISQQQKCGETAVGFGDVASVLVLLDLQYRRAVIYRLGLHRDEALRQGRAHPAVVILHSREKLFDPVRRRALGTEDGGDLLPGGVVSQIGVAGSRAVRGVLWLGGSFRGGAAAGEGSCQQGGESPCN